MNSNTKNTNTVQYSAADLERLRADPAEEVYEFEEKHLEPSQIIDAEVAGNIARAIRSAYETERARYPELSDSEIRQDLAERSVAWSNFANASHTMIFRTITDRSTTPKTMGIMQHMLDVRMRVDKGDISEEEGEQIIQTYLIEQCKK